MTDNLFSLGHIIIPLLKGVLYQDRHPNIWNALLKQQAAVQDYIITMGLTLVIDEAEGFAYLQQVCENEQTNDGDDLSKPLPKLMSRRPMSHALSVLCVLLRKKMLEQDTSGGDIRVILSREQIVNLVSVYLPSSGNEAKDIDKIYTLINKTVELGLLRKLPGDEQQFEIRRIIKALVNADHLSELEQRLEEYQNYAK